MITKEQATYLMKLVHDIDDASADMALTANGTHEEYIGVSMLPGIQGLY
ncbi:hypothetical protein [Salmonella phage SS8]|uniref:Uncharacterized protein n=1 Tax=Salmonella phage SS5 TaxID=2592216 RepID=A0A5C0CED2_9CAUD|nr:hypothetical protein QA018_gp62 [Salmonella phage SS5]QDH44747.1 hypothetical protein [Salmonella phage SF4]QDH44830.1 hypothetical protein [Salmonella phage SF5]QDH44873.1 hypothetical protein [Salmonella phage SS4]QDH44912.1 hypothetical protein [Salmonella phage SS10]QDH44980.1 hypothetical protein [Salmonella phage SI2]QDH45066.1 hypothetical protein [Salmonella phage SF1]QEI23552.1 hypothetical protein [Salmonella phage SI1]QEI24429.1 hypothetical protein [Salmonella phage SS6]QEI2